MYKLWYDLVLVYPSVLQCFGGCLRLEIMTGRPPDSNRDSLYHLRASGETSMKLIGEKYCKNMSIIIHGRKIIGQINDLRE
jgi:hypothetical protein